MRQIRADAKKRLDELSSKLAKSERENAKREKRERERERERKAKERARIEKRLTQTGIFEPKRHKSKAAKKSALDRLAKRFADFLNPKTNFFVPTRSKRAKTKANKRAAELGLKTTPKGFFFPREGAKQAKLKYNKDRAEYGVITQRKERSKATGRTRTVKRAYPIEPLATAKDKLEALRSTGERLLGSKPKPNDRLAFIVEGPHRGRSKMTYSTANLLVADLERRYDRSQRAPAHLAGKARSQFLGFLELVSVQRTTRDGWRSPPPKAKKGKRKRRLL